MKEGNQGNTEAQIGSGLMYAVGNKGIPQDFVLPPMWSNLVAAQGNKNAAKIRDDLAKEMTPPK